jgi:hypothetical protein
MTEAKSRRHFNGNEAGGVFHRVIETLAIRNLLFKTETQADLSGRRDCNEDYKLLGDACQTIV